ncbi:MAG: hypothetical protein HFF85_05635 [Oscillibacter sp.]|jgi:hypothetical protein|nr:hypothetical protein [Oscillibacter sp.]
MGVWAGAWLHDEPDRKFDSQGNRAIVKHLCFGPAETQIWYETADGQYFCELHVIEGIQAGDRFVDFIGKSKMLEVLESEIALCETCNAPELAVLFQAEKEKLTHCAESEGGGT